MEEDNKLDGVYRECTERLKRLYPDTGDQLKAHLLQLDIAVAFASMEKPLDPADPMLPEALRLLADGLEKEQQPGGKLHKGYQARHNSGAAPSASAWD